MKFSDFIRGDDKEAVYMKVMDKVESEQLRTLAQAVPIALDGDEKKGRDWKFYAAGWNACREAMLKSRSPTERAVPEGYVLMPVEPTEEILDAMYDLGIDEGDDALQVIYKAMLAAAPGAGE